MEKRILIVEDEFIVADDLRLTLEQAGYEICGVADSVEAAREQIKRERPSLALLDIHLKGELNGIALAREMKERNIGFVYLSANSNQSILEAAKSTEPYGFIIKPFRERDLLVSIDIAFYRLENGMEARWRKEMQLQQGLAIIQQMEAPWKEKVVELAKALQPFIPFDLICGKADVDTGSPLSFFAFLRVGFEEYQYIGLDELLVISNSSREDLVVVMQTTPSEVVPAIYDRAGLQRVFPHYPMKKWIAELFDMHSNMVQPMLTSSGQIRPLSFYSRKSGVFTADHLAQVSRVQGLLAAIINPTPGLYEPVPFPYIALSEKAALDERLIAGNSPAFLEALDLVRQVAPLDTSVLLLGESGVGKERIVDYLHSLSPRKKMALVKINCSAFPASLIESELFGHEKGAFTGASEKRIGKFELAHGGTIFLDEIGDMPHDLQTKLLRVLQEREIERVGGSLPVRVNVRVIAATNKNLEVEMAEGRFRLDLYYRLNVFPIRVPALRDRKEDIPLLADSFGHRFAEKMGKAYQGVSAQMMAELLTYEWPGNVRELENVIEQSVIVNNGHSPLQLRQSLLAKFNVLVQGSVATIEDVKRVQRQTEVAYLSSVLKKTRGRIRGKNGAAELLNEKPTTLESRMAKLGLRKEDFR